MLEESRRMSWIQSISPLGNNYIQNHKYQPIIDPQTRPRVSWATWSLNCNDHSEEALRYNFFHFHAVFELKMAQMIDWHPTLGVSALRVANPASTTAKLFFYDLFNLLSISTSGITKLIAICIDFLAIRDSGKLPSTIKQNDFWLFRLEVKILWWKRVSFHNQCPIRWIERKKLKIELTRNWTQAASM